MGCNCEDEKNFKVEDQGRRRFLTRLSVGIGALFAAFFGFPVVATMLDPVTRKKGKVWRAVGELNSFEEGKVRMVTFLNASPYEWSEQIAHSAAYIRREKDDRLIAFSINCSHLGCPVRWEEKAELFMCPCHGGVFYKDGSRASGPPPRGLYQYPIRINGDMVEIQTEDLPITTISAQG